jgi:GTP cyclohydrolase II
MPDIPASELCALLARLLAHGRSPETRRTALAAFQQLHADLRRWNEELVAALRAYPGFVQSGAPPDYDRFLDRLAACRDALGEADGSSDAHATLLQSARNTTDFFWQLAADAGPYLQRRPRVMDAIQTYEAASAMAFAELRSTARAAGLALPDLPDLPEGVTSA